MILLDDITTCFFFLLELVLNSVLIFGERHIAGRSVFIEFQLVCKSWAFHCCLSGNLVILMWVSAARNYAENCPGAIQIWLCITELGRPVQRRVCQLQSLSSPATTRSVKIGLPGKGRGGAGKGKICVLGGLCQMSQLARPTTIIIITEKKKVNRKSPGPGVIPGSWQSQGIGSAPPVKSAVKSILKPISAFSLAFLSFPVWTWKVIGAKSMTVDGSAARREYLFTLNLGLACSGCGWTQDMLLPPPSLITLPKGGGVKETLDCLF